MKIWFNPDDEVTDETIQTETLGGTERETKLE